MAALPEHVDLCAAFAAGSIESRDRRAFAEHLAEGCEQCEGLLPAFERATVLLAAALPISAPSPSVRDRLLDAASPAIVPLPARPRPAQGVRVAGFYPPEQFWRVLAGVGLGVSVLTCISTWHYGRLAAYWHGEASANTEVIGGLNQQLQDALTWNGLFTRPDTRVILLDSAPREEPVLHARAVYDPDNGRTVFVFSNMLMQRGREYRLWAVEGETYRFLGKIKTNAQGRAVAHVENTGDPENITGFVLSLEPANQPPAPSGPAGPVLMRGTLGG